MGYERSLSTDGVAHQCEAEKVHLVRRATERIVACPDFSSRDIMFVETCIGGPVIALT